jgi:DNA-directed RNA polymerase specialized sigma24 family protein
MSKFDDDAQPLVVDQLIAAARAALLRRCGADPLRTPASIDWAVGRLVEDPGFGLDPDGAPSARTVKVALAHLAAQRTALDSAYFQLVRPRGVDDQTLDLAIDHLHQAYVELLRKLPDNPDWCCDQHAPTVDAARAQLASRAKQRRIDGLRRSARHICVDDVENLLAEPAFSRQEAEFHELYAFLRSRLPITDHAKLERFVLHAVLELSHEAIARENGMSHEALRAESSRLARRIRPLLEARGSRVTR